MSGLQNDGSTASERLEAFRRRAAAAARHSPIKTRARSKGILADKKPTLTYGRGRKLEKTNVAPPPSPTTLFSALPVKDGSHQKRARSPPDEGVGGSPAKRLAPAPLSSPLRSPGKSRLLSGPSKPPSHLSVGSPSDPKVPFDDPFGPASSQHSTLVDADGRPLLLKKLSIEDDDPKVQQAIQAVPAQQLSPSQRLIHATNSISPQRCIAVARRSPLQAAAEIVVSPGRSSSCGRVLDFSALPEPPLSGYAALKKTLGLAQSAPLPLSPLAHGLSPRRGLTRSRSSPALNATTSTARNESPSSTAAVEVVLAPFPSIPSFLGPAAALAVEGPGPMPAPSASSSNHGLLSAVASRPSYIPRLAVLPATPSAARAAYATNASISTDMASRLASLEEMMSSMAGKEPRRRHSSVDKAPPPKTPLVGGHHLRRRVSAPDAEPAREEAQPKRALARRSSIAPANKGSLLPIASASSALAVMEEVSPTKKGMALREDEPMGLPLDSVVAFVDVRTGEGDDAGQVFVEMLRSLGAKVLNRLAPSVTHVLYKSGRPQTLSRAQTWQPAPHILNIGWIVQCREKGEHVNEAPFVLKTRPEPVFQQPKKRRVMEPRRAQFQAIDSNIKPLAAVERTKQLFMHAPRVGSPLKQAMPLSDSTNDPASEPMMAVPTSDAPSPTNDVMT